MERRGGTAEGGGAGVDHESLRYRVTRRSFVGKRQDCVIPIALTSDPDVEFLVGGDGSPVWPVASAAERATIEAIVRLFGGTMVEVDVRPGVAAEETLGGDVVGLGPAEDEVSLYAHLTGRRASPLTSLEALSLDVPPEIILHCGQRIDKDLIEFLAQASYGVRVPGVIWGRTPEELRSQVLKASCAAALNGATPKSHLSIVGGGTGVDETRKSPERLRQEIGAGYGLLSIVGHSVGVSRDLGSGAALCPRFRKDDELGLGAPECVHTGFCNTVVRRYADALASGSLLPAGDAAARVLVDLSCHSAFVGSRSVDADWSVFPELVMNPRIGAVVAVPDLAVLLSGIFAGELFGPLTAGEEVGRAIASFEQNPTVREVGLRTILFGDPRVCAVRCDRPTLVGLDSSSRQASSTRNGSKTSVRPLAGAGQISFVRALAGITKADTREQGRRTSRRLLGLLSKLEEHEDIVQALEGELGNEVRSATLAHLATTKARILEAWDVHAVLRRRGESIACPQCGWNSRPFEVTCEGGEQREFFNCPFCSDVTDVHVPADVNLSIDLPTVRCDWVRPLSSWDAAIFIGRWSASRTEMVSWPREADGTPQRTVELPERMSPAGPIRVYAIFINGLDMYSACAPTMGYPVAGQT
jgi:hypothetical protein